MKQYIEDVVKLKKMCNEFCDQVALQGNECAYTDSMLRNILKEADFIKMKYDADGIDEEVEVNSDEIFTKATLKPLTRDNMIDVLCTALEGGIGYWACLRNDTKEWEEAREAVKAKKEGTPLYEETMLELLDNGKNVCFSDAEEDDDDDESDWWKLSKPCLVRSLCDYEKQKGKAIATMLDESSFDADDADCVMQLALFGEIVY